MTGARTQVFDDGTTVTYDATGNPVAFTDTTGNSYTPDNSVLSDYARTAGGSILGAFSMAVKQAFAPAPIQAAPAAAPIQRPAVNWIGVALGVAAAAVAFRALRS